MKTNLKKPAPICIFANNEKKKRTNERERE